MDFTDGVVVGSLAPFVSSAENSRGVLVLLTPHTARLSVPRLDRAYAPLEPRAHNRSRRRARRVLGKVAVQFLGQ